MTVSLALQATFAQHESRNFCSLFSRNFNIPSWKPGFRNRFMQYLNATFSFADSTSRRRRMRQEKSRRARRLSIRAYYVTWLAFLKNFPQRVYFRLNILPYSRSCAIVSDHPSPGDLASTESFADPRGELVMIERRKSHGQFRCGLVSNH